MPWPGPTPREQQFARHRFPGAFTGWEDGRSLCLRPVETHSHLSKIERCLELRPSEETTRASALVLGEDPEALPAMAGKVSQDLKDIKRWEALTCFVNDGVLEIDSIVIENSIRPSALGKKNFLFFGHPEAGERSAVIYTLLGNCRRHEINPFDYLNDLFTRLPAATITHIEQFTPAAWVRGKAQEKLIALAT